MPEVEEKKQAAEEASTEEAKSPEVAKVPESPSDWADFDKLPAEEQERLIEEAMTASDATKEGEEEKSASETEETASVEEPAKVESKPPVIQPPPLTAEEKQVEEKVGKPPELPDEILQVDYSKYMPQGEEFDPHEALIGGTSSARARVRADAELAMRVQDFRQQQHDRQAMQATAQREFDEFVLRNPEMNDEQTKREYMNFLMTSNVDGVQMTHEELREAMKFTKYRRKQKLSFVKPKKSTATVPVTAASSSSEPEQKSVEDLEATVRSKIGVEVD